MKTNNSKMDLQQLNQLFLKPKSTSLSKLMKSDKNKVRSKLKSEDRRNRNNHNHQHLHSNYTSSNIGIANANLGNASSEDPNDLVDELELIYPHSDFSLLRNACARNEVEFFKVNETNHTSHQSMFIDPNYLNISHAYQLDYLNQLRDVVEKQKAWNNNISGNNGHVVSKVRKNVNGTNSNASAQNGGNNNTNGPTIKTVAEALALVRKKQKVSSASATPEIVHGNGNYESLDGSDNLDLKSIILSEFSENGGDVRSITRKYGLNSRVVNKWLREYLGEISPGLYNSSNSTHGEDEKSTTSGAIISPAETYESMQYESQKVHRKNKRKSNVPVQINYNEDENPLEENY